MKGFTIKNIPESSERVCNGCDFLNTVAGMRGHKSCTNTFTCKHTEFEDERGLFSNQVGRTIHFNHEGNCQTPDWCPFLKPNQNENREIAQEPK